MRYDLLPSSTKSRVEAYYGLHLVEVVAYLCYLSVEKVCLGADDLKIRRAAALVELACVFHILSVEFGLLLFQSATLVVGVVAYKGVAHLVASLVDGVLPVVERLLLLCLCHLQTSHKLTVGEDGLSETSNG